MKIESVEAIKNQIENMEKDSMYYVMASKCSTRMLLPSLPVIGKGAGQLWIEGKFFPENPPMPVLVTIRDNYENSTTLDWFESPQIISTRLYEALLACGINNFQAFDACLVSNDGKKRYEGFKAINVIGVVSMASSKTKFWDGNPSKSIDANIEDMQPVESKAHGLDFFRLAESLGTVVISKRVKNQLETYKFPYLVFRPLKNFVT